MVSSLVNPGPNNLAHIVQEIRPDGGGAQLMIYT